MRLLLALLLVPSLAHADIEEDLASKDAKTRKAAHTTLATTYKRYVIDLAKPYETYSTLSVEISGYNADLNQFTGTIYPPNVAIQGSIANDGTTILFNYRSNCVLRMNGVSDGYLTGTLKCGAAATTARSALP